MTTASNGGSVRYRTIVADPPWPISSKAGISKRRGGVDQKVRESRLLGVPYSMMAVEEIEALAVEELADADCLLFLWSTRGLFRDGTAFRVASSWGFTPFAEIIWGLRNPGMGGAAGNDHEPVLVARKGNAKLSGSEPLGVHFWRQPYISGRFHGKIHSAKPEGFLDLVEEIAEPPYVELFARRARFGWSYWGNESLETVELRA